MDEKVEQGRGEQKEQYYERKRVMTPAIDGMTVRKERACLSEIRSLSPNITHQHVLSNGWTAGEFALRYVIGHHRKRKSKSKKNIQSNPQLPEQTRKET